MTSAEFVHRPVMLEAAMAGLNVQPDGCYVDGTFGRGGHARMILASLSDKGRLLAFDKDPAAVNYARQAFGADPRFEIIHGSFTRLKELIEREELTRRINGLLLDLGVSSPQLEDPARGFSFMREGPLDMRMDTSRGQSAADWLALAAEGDIAIVLKEYGEERFARRIARAIVETRATQPLRTTQALAALVERASPFREKHKHPATRSFQAIRIFINQELGDLRDGLQQALDILAIGARLVVISFHSLEDRIVKRLFRDASRGAALPKRLPVPHSGLTPKLRLIGKATRPGRAELAANPRARSAVMRIAELLT